MGNSSSRGITGGHDADPFFYEQTTFRKTPKRYKKSPNELPDELKFAHLNPKVAAYFANKEKEKNENTLDFDDGLGNKSLLPEINRTVSLLRNRLDSLLSTEEDQLRQQFIDCRTNGSNILILLARYLYLWGGLHVALPRSLEHNLSCNFTQLIGEVYVIPREWQINSNKEEYLAKTYNSEMTSQKPDENTRPETVMSISKSTDDGEPNNGQKETNTVNESRTLSRSKSKLHMSRASTLGEINEIGEASKKDSQSRPVSRVAGDSVPRMLVSKKESRDKGETPKPKTRLEKYKSNLQLDTKPSGAESRRGLRKESVSVIGEPIVNETSKLLSGGAKDAGYWAVINFQLSNALYEEMGWIVHPTSKEDPERETILEWATQRLQHSMKEKKRQDQELREQGYDKPTVIRYYGDSRKEMVEKYKSSQRGSSASSLKNKPVYKGEKPTIPDAEGPGAKPKRPFLVTTSDGASTVFYPSGRPAIVMCRLCTASEDKPEKMKTPAFYTLVYDNTPEQKMLGCFTPSGRNCVYHNNGKVKFLSDNCGGTLSTEEGAIQRRWKWPAHHKMPVPVAFQINNSITFRCVNMTQMQLYFSCEKETCKLQVGAVPGCEQPSKEELGQLVSGTSLSSQASKEFSKPLKQRTPGVKKKTLKSKLDPQTHKKSKSRSGSVDSQNSCKMTKNDSCSKEPHSKQSVANTQKTIPKRGVSFALQALSMTSKEKPSQPKPKLNQVLSEAFGEMKTSVLQKKMRFSFYSGSKTHHNANSPYQTTAKSALKIQEPPSLPRSCEPVRKQSFSPKTSFELPLIEEKKPESCKEKPTSNSLIPTLPPLCKIETRSNVDLTEYLEDQLRSQSSRSMSVPFESQSALLNSLLDKPNDRRETSPALVTSFDPSVPVKISETAQIEKERLEKEKRSKAELERLLNMPEESENDEDADKDLFRLQRKIKNVVEDWLEHYRMAMGISSPYLKAVRDPGKTKRVRDIRSAKPGGGVVIIEREATAVPRPRVSVRARSAYIARDERPSTGSSNVTVQEAPELGAHARTQVKFEDTVQSSVYPDHDAYSLSRTNTYADSSIPGSAGSRSSSRAHSAPGYGAQLRPSHSRVDPGVNPAVALCPIALRLSLLGHQRVVCRCSRHKIPNISDVEFDEFVQKQAPEKQLVVICVKSSLAPTATPAETMLEQMHDERNRNRTKPCMQSRNDPQRLFWYDVISAADFSDHTQPLLIRRHNVVPGMFLVYESGNLLFCDHIFNGYGNARKDFQKQLDASRKSSILGQTLPKDFKFSPIKGRSGMRSGWGGEIGGVLGSEKKNSAPKRGLDGQKRGSISSLSSGDSKDLPLDYSLSGVNFSTSPATELHPRQSGVSFSKHVSYRIRPLSQPNFDSEDSRIQTLVRPRSQMDSPSMRVSLPEIESSA